LLWRLTGGRAHFTDVTNASRTLLLNIHTQQWDKELLDIFNIPANILPEIVDNHGHFGSTTLLGDQIAICALAGDQQAAAFGQACFKPGMVKSTYGTGAFMLLNTGDKIVKSKERLLSTIQYRIPNHLAYGIEGSIFIAGAAVQWLRDNLKIIKTSAEIETLAETVDNNGGVYFIPAFTGLGAPFWNPYARGLMTGLTRDTQNAHIARACLEAIAYQTKDLLIAMEKDGANIDSLLVDGGMSANNNLLQFLADILNITVKRPKIIETTALGIAYLISLELKIYTSLTDISNIAQSNQLFKPHIDKQQRHDLYQTWRKWITVLDKNL
jgi:glycerol kinase